MNKKTWIILFGVVVILVGVVLFASQTQAPTPEMDEVATTTDEEMDSSSVTEPGSDTNGTDVDDGTTEDTSTETNASDDSDSMVDDDSVISMHRVAYTSDGFSPSTIEVQVGDTVVWQSEDGSSMWVASAVHPTHEVYAGTSLNEHCGDGSDVFDQCDTGERYEFTFEKEGEWGYHNHVRAGHTGKVIVTE